jgi:hypothetical protein
MNSYITILILTSVIFLSACKPRECEIPDAPPFTLDQLTWIDSTSYNYKVTYQASDGVLHVDTVRSHHTSHKGPTEGRTGSGVRCEQAIKYYTGKTQCNIYFKLGGGISFPFNIESKDKFTVYPGVGNEYFTNDPRTDTANVQGVVFTNVFKFIDQSKRVYISKSHGVILCENLINGHPKIEILP